MISEEYDSHLCTPIPIGTKTIEIDYYRIIEDHLGRTVISTKDMDGIIYRLVKREKKISESSTNRRILTGLR